MTITSTEERVEPVGMEVVADRAMESGTPSRPPVAPGAGWTWVDVEDAEPPGVRPDWMTWFAWAKAMGGW